MMRFLIVVLLLVSTGAVFGRKLVVSGDAGLTANDDSTETLYVRDLLQNGEADLPASKGWFNNTWGGATQATVSSEELAGKSGTNFFTGNSNSTGSVTMVQTVDLNSIAEDIDASHVAAGLAARLGGTAMAASDMELNAFNTDGTLLESAVTSVTSSLRNYDNRLIPSSVKICKLPVTTRILEVFIKFSDPWSTSGVHGAADALSLGVGYTGPIIYADGENLVPMPSAETSAALCLWEGVDLRVTSVYPGGDGKLQYTSNSEGNSNVSAWIDITKASASIDADRRMVLLDAFIGGIGDLDDSGEVTVSFFDSDKHPLGPQPLMTTGRVTADDRAGKTTLLQREAAILVPHGARFAKVTMLFFNGVQTDAAAIDNINMRMLFKPPTHAPSGSTESPQKFVFGIELVMNGNADYKPQTGWDSYGYMTVERTAKNVPGALGDFIFRGPRGKDGKPGSGYSSFYQTFDLSGIGEIAIGNAAIGFSAMAGAVAVGSAEVTLTIAFNNAAGDAVGMPIWIDVGPEARDNEAKLILVEHLECNVLADVRSASISVEFKHFGTLLNNDAAVDAISMRVVSKAAIPFAIEANLVPSPSAESSAAICLWHHTALTTSRTYPGGDGTLQFSANISGTTSATLWVDLSSDTGIVEGDRHISLMTSVGGNDASDNSGELTITLCDKDRNEIGVAPSATTGIVTAADRNSLPHLVERSTLLSVPTMTRWAKVEMIFHNSAASVGAAVDSIDLRLHATLPTLAPSTGPPTGDIFDRELIHNGGAEHEPSVGWSREWGPLEVVRSDDELSGKVGNDFFRGPMGTPTRPASTFTSMTQMVDLSDASSEIDAGLVDVGFSARIGSIHADEAGGMAMLSFFATSPDDYVHIDDTTVSVPAPARGGKPGLIPVFRPLCAIPATIRSVEVLIMLSHNGGEVNNEAAIDSISMRLNRRKPLTFTLDSNLAPFPHAEAMFAPCGWESKGLQVQPSFDGGDGQLQFVAGLGGDTNATVWIDMSSEALAIDAGQRHATLSARVGGNGPQEDSGEVLVNFFDADKNKIYDAVTLTTGKVAAVLRSGLAMLLQRHANTSVPIGARWAQLAMVFHNTNASTTIAAVDEIDFRILASSATASQAPEVPNQPVPVDPSVAPSKLETAAPLAPIPNLNPTLSPTDASESPTVFPTHGPSISSAATIVPVAPNTTPTSRQDAGVENEFQPPKLAVSIRTVAQVVTGITFVSAAIAGPYAAAQLGPTLAAVAAATDCGRGSETGNVAPLWPFNPLQMKVNAATPGAYYRGAVVGNSIVLALAALGLVAVVGALRTTKSPQSTQPWRASMATICFPGCVLIPATLVAPGLMYGALGAVLTSGEGLDYFCAALAFIFVLGSIALTIFFAASAPCGALENVQFELSLRPETRITWIVGDIGAWITGGRGGEPSAEMMALLYRPLRGLVFLWCLPHSIAVAAAAGAAAGAAGASCKVASILLVSTLCINSIVLLVLRPFICRLLAFAACGASVLAALAAVQLAVAAFRNYAEPAVLVRDNRLDFAVAVAIVGILFVLVHAVVSAVKMVVHCHKLDTTEDAAGIEKLFGGDLAHELTSVGDVDSLAMASAEPNFVPVTLSDNGAASKVTSSAKESMGLQALAPQGSDDDL